MLRPGAVLGVMILACACSGANEADDVGDTAEPVSSFEVLRGGDLGHTPRSGSLAVRKAIRAGASRIADLQADTIGDNARNGLTDPDPDDGGWDFTLAPTATSHTPATSPPNLFGATALAPWAAVHLGVSGTRELVTALDAGLGMQRNPDVDSAPDFVFGVLLAELADNPGFATLARQHYDAKRAAAGGATGLGTFIRDGRHARNEDGLIGYDLGWLVLGAAALDAAFPGAGYRADADTYARIVVDDLTSASPRFDPQNGNEQFYITGLAWSLVSASRLGAGSTFRMLRDLLLQNQRSDGAWGADVGHPDPDLQSTAHAIQTLALAGHENDRSRQAARRAARWLIGQQASSGGWPDATHTELPLVNADIAIGLFVSQTREGQEDGLAPEAAVRTDAPAASGAAPHAAPFPL